MDYNQQHHDLVRDGDAQVRVVSCLEGRPDVVVVIFAHAAAAAAGLQQPPSLSQHRIPAHLLSRSSLLSVAEHSLGFLSLSFSFYSVAAVRVHRTGARAHPGSCAWLCSSSLDMLFIQGW